MSAVATPRDVVEVDTETAAHVVGKNVPAFKMWAARQRPHPLRPARVERRGRRNVAMWDLEQLHEALDHGR